MRDDMMMMFRVWRHDVSGTLQMTRMPGPHMWYHQYVYEMDLAGKCDWKGC